MDPGAAAIGVDLGGTTYSLGIVAPDGSVSGLRESPTRSHRPPDEILAEIAGVVLEVAAASPHPIDALGLGFPGAIDAASGRVLLPPNFGPGWHDFPVADVLARATGLASHIINDARAFTLAEARLGAARGARDLLGITLGTGVGGGFVLDGRLYLGAYCTAGEFGHQLYDPHGPTCGCGSPGCIEVFASGPAIVAAAVRPFLQGRAAILREHVGGDLARLTPRAVAEAAEAGDMECREILERAAQAIAVGIVNVTHLLGPEVVVVGGGVARAGELLLGPMREYVESNARMVEQRPRIVAATLGDAAGVIGSATWARETAAGGSARELGVESIASERADG